MTSFIKKYSTKLAIGILIILVAVFLFETYLPLTFAKSSFFIYSLESGMGYKQIARDLENQGMVRNALSFELYALISGSYAKLQAGKYDLSRSMSVAEIVKKFTTGDIAKDTITIIEGWNLNDLAISFEDKGIYLKKEFLDALQNDFSDDFAFLKEKPQSVGLEGYLFPDTYYIAKDTKPEEFIKIALSNFDRKLTPELRQEIVKQNKSIFQIMTMASMLEKEVQSLEDKKIVSGILWKRIKEGIPLQVDATVNYVTGKHDAKVSLKDAEIDSRYNTYKYYGLPKGPISNPGLDSILAAMYPTKTDYWYYLSADGTGKTIFSKTLEEHIATQRKYFK